MIFLLYHFFINWHSMIRNSFPFFPIYIIMVSGILKIIYLMGYHHWVPYFYVYIVPDLASESTLLLIYIFKVLNFPLITVKIILWMLICSDISSFFRTFVILNFSSPAPRNYLIEDFSKFIMEGLFFSFVN